MNLTNIQLITEITNSLKSLKQSIKESQNYNADIEYLINDIKIKIEQYKNTEINEECLIDISIIESSLKLLESSVNKINESKKEIDNLNYANELTKFPKLLKIKFNSYNLNDYDEKNKKNKQNIINENIKKQDELLDKIDDYLEMLKDDVIKISDEIDGQNKIIDSVTGKVEDNINKFSKIDVLINKFKTNKLNKLKNIFLGALVTISLGLIICLILI